MKISHMLTRSGLLCLLVCSGLLGCAVDRGQIYVKNGHRYGFTGNIWRDTWWNYYERGTSYADGGYWPDAIEDFQVAIRQRADDRRQARTVGLDAIDYFPHRELGIVYYHLKRYGDAVDELETSLAATESAKAKFYLNASRKALVEQAHRDTVAPRIRLAEALDGTVTNRLTLTLRGRVEDDTYVAAMVIDGRRQFIELAEPAIDFAQEVTLREGLNSIDIMAADLLGHVTRQQIKIHVDRQGPLVSLSQVEAVDHGNRRRVRVHGTLTDDSDIARLRIGGQVVALTSMQEGQFRVDVAVDPGATLLSFEAEDVIGNTTRDAMLLRPVAERQTNHDIRPMQHRLAVFRSGHVRADLVKLRLPWHRDRNPPVIKPKFMPLSGRKGTENESYVKLYDNTIFIEGRVSDASLITAFSIDGESLGMPPGKQLFFAKHMPLEVGEKTFVLKAVDNAGNAAVHRIIVNRIAQSINTPGARLRVLLLPFDKAGQSSTLAGSAYEHLYNAFVQQGRFSIRHASQLPPDLQSLPLDASAHSDLKRMSKVGKVLGVDAMLVGTLVERDLASDRSQRDLEAHVRFVDVHTSIDLAAEDVYHVDSRPEVVKTLMQGLAWKIQQHFPLVEGRVIKIQGDRLFIDLGNRYVKKGMMVNVFRHGEELKDSVTGQSFGAPTEILGEANVQLTADKFSEVTLLSIAEGKRIQQSDRVMTK